MSDEVISIEEVIAYSLDTFPGLIIWLVYKDRSQKVAFHALQSMWYQIGWLIILAVGWTVTTFLLVVLVGFVLIPVMAIVSVVSFVHAGYAAYRVSQGEEYRYPFSWI